MEISLNGNFANDTLEFPFKLSLKFDNEILNGNFSETSNENFRKNLNEKLDKKFSENYES